MVRRGMEAAARGRNPSREAKQVRQTQSVGGSRQVILGAACSDGTVGCVHMLARNAEKPTTRTTVCTSMTDCLFYYAPLLAESALDDLFWHTLMRDIKRHNTTLLRPWRAFCLVRA